MLYEIIENKNVLTNDHYITFHAYETFTECCKSVFHADSIVIWSIDTGRPPKGKTYNLKKKALRSKAFNYKWIIDNNPNLTAYSFNTNITDYFYRYGKKYGLLRDFKRMRIV